MENFRKTFCASLVVSFVLAGSVVARADCITGGRKVHAPLEALKHPGVLAHEDGARSSGEGSPESIVGLWTVTFLFDHGPEVFDHGFEQFHADGNELTIDTAVSPAAGNICVGVWERDGHWVKLHHVGWNWDTSVTPAALAGIFVLDMKLKVEHGGHTFSGHYVTDSYDNNGQVVPEFHAEGDVKGHRISVH